MAKMYLMSGCSGAGKTTFAKAFAMEHDLKYLGVDDFYAFVNGDECIHTNTFEVWIAFYQAIHEAEVNNIDVVVDTNAITRSHREQFIEWFPTFEHHLIYIDANIELRMKNNKSRRRQVPDDVMVKMTERLQSPWFDEKFESIIWVVNNENHFEEYTMLKGVIK